MKSGSVISFIKPYVNTDVLSFLKRDSEISFLHYNWGLNAKEPLKNSKV